MYLDLFPRDNKCKLIKISFYIKQDWTVGFILSVDPHAACFPLQPSYIAQNGERVAPIAAMVANFTKP
jgi:hypothetical protein